MSMSSGSSETPAANPPGTAHRVRVIIFRVVAGLAGLFFVVAVALMASAPWVLLQPDQVTRTELNRWFLTVAGSVDAIAAGVLLALAPRPRRTLLIVEHAGAAIVAGAIILPFQPSFAAILAIGVVPLIAHPYWREVRTFPSWWTGVSRAVLILARVGGCRSSCHGSHCIPATDRRDRSGGPRGLVAGPRRARNRLALAGVLAACRGPGRRILRALCSAVWLYLGMVARAGPSASPWVLGSSRRRCWILGRHRFRRRRLARLQT